MLSEDGAPNKPTYVRTRTYSDSVVLLWRPPTGDTLVRGYMVGYGEGVPDVNWRYVSSASRNVTITGLSMLINASFLVLVAFSSRRDLIYCEYAPHYWSGRKMFLQDIK